jgi:hypothetical protein
MPQRRLPASSLGRLLSLAATAGCFAGCASVGITDPPRCPRPNVSEAFDLETFDKADESRPAATYVRRLMVHCFPEEYDGANPE